MVFTVSSNEHTTKVVLSSKTATGGTGDNPKFTLRTPISTPDQMISMVCLESVIIEAPSMFCTSLINDAANEFDITSNSGGLTYDWYNSIPAGLVSLVGTTDYMKDILTRCINNDMTNVDNIAKLLYDLVNNLIGVILTFPNTPGKSTANTLTWTPVNGSTIAHVTLVADGVTYTDLLSGGLQRDPTQGFFATLSLFLRRMTLITFSVKTTLPATLRIAGPWVKIFGLNPLYTRSTTQFYTFSDTVPLQLTMQTQGYDMIHMHTNFCRSVNSAAPLGDNYYIVPGNIFWSIQVISDPFRKTYFTNYNTAGKITYYHPILEEIEVYFTDEWGDRIKDPITFQVVMTFDFTVRDPMPQSQTIYRARMSRSV